MGISGISFWQLLIILLIIVLLFGTTKLRSIGSDLGSAIKGFRSAVKDEEDGGAASKPESTEKAKQESIQHTESGHVIDSQASLKEKDKVG